MAELLPLPCNIFLALNVLLNLCALAMVLAMSPTHYVKSMPGANPKIFTTSWFISLVLMAAGLLCASIYFLVTQVIDVVDAWTPPTYMRSLLLYGSFQLRITTLGFVVDRGIATFCMQSYRCQEISTVSVGIILYLMLVPLVMILCYFKAGMAGWRLTVMVFAVDFVVISTCIAVFLSNRKLLRKRASGTLSLNERYQVNENVRFLHVLFPSATSNFLSCSVFLLSHLLVTVGVSMPTPYRMLGTHVGYSLLVLLSFFIPMLKDGTFADGLRRKIGCWSAPFAPMQVNPNRDVVEQVNGDIYFVNYAAAWKAP